jgi:hypothetical protein
MIARQFVLMFNSRTATKSKKQDLTFTAHTRGWSCMAVGGRIEAD